MSWLNSLQNIAETTNKVAGTISAARNPLPAAPTNAGPAPAAAAPMDWKKFLIPGGIALAAVVLFVMLRKK